MSPEHEAGLQHLLTGNTLKAEKQKSGKWTFDTFQRIIFTTDYLLTTFRLRLSEAKNYTNYTNYNKNNGFNGLNGFYLLTTSRLSLSEAKEIN